MSAMSDYLETRVVDHVLGTTTFNKPAAVYLGLFTAAPNDAGGGTEVAGSGYARQALPFAAATSPGGAASNSAAKTFTAAGGAWGTITHWALFDAVSAGNMLIWGAFNASKVIGDGDSALINIGDIVVTGA